MIWAELAPEHKREAVRQLVQVQGKTYSAAALLLGTTRTAIAGVVDRARKPGRTPIATSSGFKNRKGHGHGKPPKARARVDRLVSLDPPMPPAPLPSPDAWLALPGSHPVPIAAHTDGCRFPIGLDRPFLYCNEPVADGRSYCPVHHARVFREVPVKRKARV